MAEVKLQFWTSLGKRVRLTLFFFHIVSNFFFLCVKGAKEQPSRQGAILAANISANHRSVQRQTRDVQQIYKTESVQRQS